MSNIPKSWDIYQPLGWDGESEGDPIGMISRVNHHDSSPGNAWDGNPYPPKIVGDSRDWWIDVVIGIDIMGDIMEI